MPKYFHKVIGVIKDEEYVLTIAADEAGTLKEALLSLFETGVDDVLFAGTCLEEDLEFFGNDCVEWVDDTGVSEDDEPYLN